MKYKLSASLSGKVDRVSGTIKGLSVITAGPALGHGVDVDEKTLSQVLALSRQGPVKVQWTHGGLFSGDRLGEEAGMLTGPFLDGNQLRAHFQAFDAFKKAHATRFDYLFEMAEKCPANLGLSIAFDGSAVWRLEDGSEIEADVPRPANAMGENPRVRVDRLVSADFVSDPAANAGGLFAAGKVTELLDLKQKLSVELAELAAKLSANGDELKAKDASNAELAGKLDAANKMLETERATFTAKETEFTAKVTAADATIKELSATVAKHVADIEATKIAAAEKDAAHKAELEAMHHALQEFGAMPVNIYNGPAIDRKATFAAITDPAAKRDYWQKHKAELLAA